MRFPQSLTLKEIEVHMMHELAAEQVKQQAKVTAEMSEIRELLGRARAEAPKLRRRETRSHNYYARDKLAMKCDWETWLRRALGICAKTRRFEREFHGVKGTLEADVRWTSGVVRSAKAFKIALVNSCGRTLWCLSPRGW